MREKILSKLNRVDDLPSIPIVIQKISEAVNDPDTEVADLAKIIENDPAIMARTLKMVNSAFYAGRLQKEGVTNIKTAIIRLGFDAVRKIALTTSVFSMFQSTEQNLFNRMEFWRHSIMTGLVAGRLVDLSTQKNFNVPFEDIALVGLLHDMGKIIFEQYFHTEFNKILAWCKSNQFPLYVVEEKVFRISHSELGAWLSKRWNLQEHFGVVIQYHHHPEQAIPEFQKLTQLTHIADYVVNKIGAGESGNGLPPTIEEAVWPAIGLNLADLDMYCEEAEKESEKADILLSLA